MGIPNTTAARQQRTTRVYCTCLLNDGKTEVTLPIKAANFEQARKKAHAGYAIMCVLDMITEADKKKKDFRAKSVGYRTDTRFY